MHPCPPYGLTAGSYGYVGLKAVGRWGQIAVDVSLVLSQAGFCCVYVIFIAKNVLQLLNTTSCWLDGSYLWAVILLQWPVFTPLTWIRRMTHFGPTNLLADAIIAAGLTGILAYSIHGIVTAGGGVSVPMFNTGGWSLMLGTAVYAFEGVGMVVPVYDSLSVKGQRSFPTVLTLTLAGIATTYVIIGLVPYLYFSGVANVVMTDSVTLNLPRVWWSYLIQAGYCLALLFSYPLMLFPAVKVLEKPVTPWLLRDDGSTKWRKNAYRSAIVAATLGVALVGSEQLNNFVSLVGCFCCTPLAFIYPCLFHLRLVKGTPWTRASNVAIIVFGVAVFVWSTYEAIAQWSIEVLDPCAKPASA
jgi:proton-coupled amino acid transporter